MASESKGFSGSGIVLEVMLDERDHPNAILNEWCACRIIA
jgi:hypothetical protein